MNWQRILVIVLWILGVAGVLVSVAFVEREQDSVKCKQVLIHVEQEGENYFIDRDDIYTLIVRNGDSLVNKPLNSIHVKSIERAIVENKFVQDAEVYTDLEGILHVQVLQRKPVLRIFNTSNRSFYVDEHGLKMPLSENYAARVLAANGHIEEIYGGIFDSVQTPVLKELIGLTAFIRKDPFWDAQIEQVYVEPNQDFVLIPRVGNHKIIFGDTTDMQEKFDNLMIFYKRALPKVGWNTYATINVKFKGQIVCVKNGNMPVLPPAKTDSTTTDSINTVL